MTLDEFVAAWRAGMQDSSKDETAREHWLRKQLASAEARGYARAREQAADLARSWEGRHPPAGWSDAGMTGGRIATDEVADDIRAMKDEGGR